MTMVMWESSDNDFNDANSGPHFQDLDHSLAVPITPLKHVHSEKRIREVVTMRAMK